MSGICLSCAQEELAFPGDMGPPVEDHEAARFLTERVEVFSKLFDAFVNGFRVASWLLCIDISRSG